MPRINVRIPADGKIVVDADGFSGATCKDATAAIESALSGGDAKITVEDKPELYESGEQEFNTQKW